MLWQYAKNKQKVRTFVDHIERLSYFSDERIVDGFDQSQRELLTQFLLDTKEFIEYNEWGIGLELLLNNLYEINFTIDQTAVVLAQEALDICGYNYTDWQFIEELKR